MTESAFVPTTDRLEEAWRALRDNIRGREAELAALRSQFQILDEARALLIMRAGAGDAAVIFDSARSKVGLREAVLTSVMDSETGIGFAELCAAVMRQVKSDRYSSERSLAAAVQTTVRRLIAKGEVALYVQDGVRMYVSGPNTQTPDELEPRHNRASRTT